MWAWEKQKNIGNIDILSGGSGGHSTCEEAFTFECPLGEDLGQGFSDWHSKIPQSLPDNSQSKRQGFLFLGKFVLEKAFFVVVLGGCFCCLPPHLGDINSTGNRKLMLKVSNLWISYKSKNFPSIPHSQPSLQKKPPLKVYCGLSQKHHMHLPSNTDMHSLLKNACT